MPCSCQKPEPDYPESDHWGPPLWSILHILAERGGRAVATLYQEDEKRQWISLIQLLPKMIPCPMCRQHCEEWLIFRPITDLKNIAYTNYYSWLTTWVYDFHESVNNRTGKPSFDKSLLAATYGPLSIKGTLQVLKPHIETAIRLTGLTILPWNKWLVHLKMLCSIYGIS
jgi:hypothetical protein